MYGLVALTSAVMFLITRWVIKDVQRRPDKYKITFWYYRWDLQSIYVVLRVGHSEHLSEYKILDFGLDDLQFY